MTVTVTVSNTINVNSVAGDYGELTLPAIYDESAFSYWLQFTSIDTGGDTPTYNNITSVTVNTSPSLTGLGITTINTNPLGYIIQLSGPVYGSFSQTFEFLTVNNGLQILPTNTDISYYGLVRWTPPTDFLESINFTFNITYDVNPPEQVTLSELIYWNYSIGISNFNTLLSRGIY
jgi:hypothetical protein